METKIKSKRVWLGSAFLPAVVAIKYGRIDYIGEYDSPCDAVDYGEDRIVPGFIDVHTHGAYGAAANYSGEEELRVWTSKLPAEGVTAYLPSTFSEDVDSNTEALVRLADLIDKRPDGAEILGIHMEGPFLNKEFKGAMLEKMIISPSVELMNRFQEAARGNVKYMTMAVEMDPDFAVTRYAREAGIIITIGHSGATYRQAMMGLANGARCFTHAFNAMSPLKHRAAGCAGAMMRSDCFVEAIFDGHHVDWEVLNLIFKTKGPDRVVGISDSITQKGSTSGVYKNAWQDIYIDEEGSAYINGTNTLAGSTLMYNIGLRQMVEEAQIPFGWALNAISANPAKLLGLDNRLGHIKAGYDADMVVLDDKYNVRQTFCKGKKQK